MSENHWTWSMETQFPSVRGANKPIIEEILGQLQGHGWRDHDLFGIHLALEEALVNAIRHGNGFDSSKQVHVACKISRDGLWIQIADEGPGFNPDRVPDCTAEENLEATGGRGIMLMRSFMNRVDYTGRGNAVVMEKTRTDGHL